MRLAVKIADATKEDTALNLPSPELYTGRCEYSGRAMSACMSTDVSGQASWQLHQQTSKGCDSKIAKASAVQNFIALPHGKYTSDSVSRRLLDDPNGREAR